MPSKMTAFGYTIMGEQAGPQQLVRDAVRAEELGFDFIAASDHYNPWLEAQGHSPYTWSVLGAIAQATERIELMTYVTCPTIRYHPAVVAQKAATVQLLSDGRFTLGLGAGERLNEHVVGRDWPAVDPAPRHARRSGPDHPTPARRGDGDLSRRAPPSRGGEAVGRPTRWSGDRDRRVGRGVLPAGR